jgi:choice-of-anchor C domain-containing protein
MKKTNLMKQESITFIPEPTLCFAAVRKRANPVTQRIQSLTALLCLLLLSVIAYPLRAANLLANGGFETPNVEGTHNFYSVTPPGFGWVLESGTIDIMDDAWQHAAGEQSLDLHGNSPGTIYQDIATEPGERYRIQFAYAGAVHAQCGAGGNKTFNVLWGGALIDSVSFNTVGRTTTSMGWVYYTAEVTASSTTTRLRFQSTTTGGTICGPTLDDVSVTELVTIRLATSQWTPVPTGWQPYPFLNGGGSQDVISTTSSIDTDGLQDPAPEPIYQHLQKEGSPLTWTVNNLPAGTYKVRVHLSGVEFSQYWSVSETVWVSSGGSPHEVHGVSPYGSAGYNQAWIVEFPEMPASGQLWGGMTPTAAGNTAVVCGVEILENP